MTERSEDPREALRELVTCAANYRMDPKRWDERLALAVVNGEKALAQAAPPPDDEEKLAVALHEADVSGVDQYGSWVAFARDIIRVRAALAQAAPPHEEAAYWRDLYETCLATTTRLEGAFRLALIQIEHDGEVKNRLTQALRVATHTPHDQDGTPDPDSGFPVCSVCGAIQTEAAPPSDHSVHPENGGWCQTCVDHGIEAGR
jgi:hypothetical protein